MTLFVMPVVLMYIIVLVLAVWIAVSSFAQTRREILMDADNQARLAAFALANLYQRNEKPLMECDPVALGKAYYHALEFQRLINSAGVGR